MEAEVEVRQPKAKEVKELSLEAGLTSRVLERCGPTTLSL